jgi:dienelactone hydrolase
MKKIILSFLLLAGFSLVDIQSASAQGQTSDVGNFYPFLYSYSQNQNSSLSFLAEDWESIEDWRKNARQKLDELLGFHPDPVPLQAEIVDSTKREGYTQYLVKYSLNVHQQTEAFLLIPDNLTKPAPAVIALHDHGGFYYFGKEKHNQIDNPPAILQQYIDGLYEGRTYADELAKRGFVVLSPDAIFFGSQRVKPEDLSPGIAADYYRETSGDADNQIRAFNRLSSGLEIPMNKTILASGTTWAGIIAHGDRRAIDFLLTRPEVDPERIGAMGLSLGGLRTTYLFGMDSRIKAGVIAGFSSSYRQMLQQHFRHTWMMYVPLQYQFFDLPDVASLNAPRPLMIMNAKRDHLFPMEGMKAAEEKLNQIYLKMGSSEKFKCSYYDAPHSMTIEMQEDAFDWLEKWLD